MEVNDVKPPKDSLDEQPKDKEKTPEPERIKFECSFCHQKELVDYFGKKPPFTRNIEFQEDCYVMVDPFSPAPSRLTSKSYTEYFVVMGAHCKLCEAVVCKDPSCSIYYLHSFCLQCAEENIKKFPLEIQSKIKKEVVALKSQK